MLTQPIRTEIYLGILSGTKRGFNVLQSKEKSCHCVNVKENIKEMYNLIGKMKI